MGALKALVVGMGVLIVAGTVVLVVVVEVDGVVDAVGVVELPEPALLVSALLLPMTIAFGTAFPFAVAMAGGGDEAFV